MEGHVAQSKENRNVGNDGDEWSDLNTEAKGFAFAETEWLTPNDVLQRSNPRSN